MSHSNSSRWDSGGVTGLPVGLSGAKHEAVLRRLVHYSQPIPSSAEHILLVLKHHRAEPTAADIFSGMRFAQQWIRLLLNLAGAGASIRQHLHWQGLPIDFPVFSRRYISRVVHEDGDVRVCLLSDPWCGFRLDVRTDAGRSRIAHAVACWSQPYNLVLQDSAIYFCPRTKEVPPQFPTFKFGGAEVGGIIYAKSRVMLQTIDHSSIEAAIREVGLSVHNRR